MKKYIKEIIVATVFVIGISWVALVAGGTVEPLKIDETKTIESKGFCKLYMFSAVKDVPAICFDYFNK